MVQGSCFDDLSRKRTGRMERGKKTTEKRQRESLRVGEMNASINTTTVAARTKTSFLSLRGRRRMRTGQMSSVSSSLSLSSRTTTTTTTTVKYIHSVKIKNVANSGGRERPQQREHVRTKSSSSSSSSNNETIITNTKGKMLKWSDIDEKTKELPDTSVAKKMQITGVHHVAIIVKDMKRTMDFYQGILGLAINPARPEDKLPYDGAWLWIGDEMIHIMELPNPDPDDIESRPTHGGRDRHFCIGCMDIQPLMDALDANKIEYTKSKSGRPAIFFRDPDSNTLEVVEGLEWRV